MMGKRERHFFSLYQHTSNIRHSVKLWLMGPGRTYNVVPEWIFRRVERRVTGVQAEEDKVSWEQVNCRGRRWKLLDQEKSGEN